MPRNFSTEAIVLGSHRLREADRIVTLFTLDRGKVPTVVKGVRKVSSRFGGRLEPFTYLRVSLHEGRSLHTLTSADTIRTHAASRDHPAALKAGLSFINLLARETNDLEGRPRTYNLLVRFLDELDRLVKSSSAPACLPLLALSADLKLLLLAGYLPLLDNCPLCGRNIEAPARFSAAAGGAICNDCRADAFPLSVTALATMEALLKQPLSAVPEIIIDSGTAREVWRAIREICHYHLGIDLKIAPV